MSILMMLVTVILAAVGVMRLSGYAIKLSAFKDLSDSLGFAEKVLTVFAILAAAFWYFFERPDSAKVDIVQNVSVVPVPVGYVMVLSEISIKNVGSTVLDFNDSPYSIEVLQVTPLTEGPTAEFNADYGRHVRRVRYADQWSLIARFRSDQRTPGLKKTEMDVPGLTSLIEANETENLYHRVIAPCSPDLRLAVRSQFRKPRTWQDAVLRREAVYWTKQTYVDATGVCAPPPAAAPPSPPHRGRKK